MMSDLVSIRKWADFLQRTELKFDMVSAVDELAKQVGPSLQICSRWGSGPTALSLGCCLGEFNTVLVLRTHLLKLSCKNGAVPNASQ